MQKLRLIKLTALTFALLLLGFMAQAQTYLNLRSMPSTTPGSLDYAIFGHASGTNLFWYRDYWTDIYANFTNSTAGQAMIAATATNTAAIAALVTSNANVVASIAATSNALTTASNALATATATASAKTTTASNAIVALLANYYPSNNPNSFQTAQQVTATAMGAAAAAAAGAVSSNGVASFTAVTSRNVLFSPLDCGSVPTTYFLDLSTASFQRIAFTNTSGGASLEIKNASAGQNVTVALKNSTGSAQTFYLPNYFQTNVFNITANASTIANVANTRTLIFNFLTFSSGQVFMSYATAY